MARSMATPSTRIDQIWTAVRSAPRSPVEPRPRTRRAHLDDISVAICLLALVALVLLGGLLALFSAATTVLPTSGAVACRTLEGCVESASETDQAGSLDTDRTRDPQQTR